MHQTAFSVIKQFMMDESGEDVAIDYANDLLRRLKDAGVTVIDPMITCFGCHRNLPAELFESNVESARRTCPACGYCGVDTDREQEWADQFGFSLPVKHSHHTEKLVKRKIRSRMASR